MERSEYAEFKSDIRFFLSRVSLAFGRNREILITTMVEFFEYEMESAAVMG